MLQFVRQLLVDQRTGQIDQDALLFPGRGTPVSTPVAISGARAADARGEERPLPVSFGADGGLLGFEVAPEFVHQGGGFREGMIDGLDAAAKYRGGVFPGGLYPVLFHEGRKGDACHRYRGNRYGDPAQGGGSADCRVIHRDQRADAAGAADRDACEDHPEGSAVHVSIAAPLQAGYGQDCYGSCRSLLEAADVGGHVTDAAVISFHRRWQAAATASGFVVTNDHDAGGRSHARRHPSDQRLADPDLQLPQQPSAPTKHPTDLSWESLDCLIMIGDIMILWTSTRQ
ncbi:hypothetical protein ACIBIZ_37715 [Nonomuraea spiralis]|uniref:hypothetical protein n=1 Tax=Nonomuraea spiralis TaxID=46182 RepID=UPI00379C7FAC